MTTMAYQEEPYQDLMTAVVINIIPAGPEYLMAGQPEVIIPTPVLYKLTVAQ